MRFVYRFSVLLVLFATLLAATPAQATPGERCFTQTGYCISGTIRAYWEQNGGLPVFGYPITPQRTETIDGSWTGPVQWFERDRLEDHTNEGNGVLAGRLGDQFLRLQGSDWTQLPRDNTATAGCRFFRETSYNLCEPFLSYWEQKGGLSRFGYPISRQRNDTIEGLTYTVQYFERRRMEYHPENVGTPNTVLLGLLGRDVYAAGGAGPLVEPTVGDVPADIQQTILGAAYATLRSQMSGAKLVLGLVDVTGDYAAVLAQPLNQPTIYIYLKRTADIWKVIENTTNPSTTVPDRRGIPKTLWADSDRATIVYLALAQFQNPEGSGLTAYVTRPRLAGDFARLWLAPGANEPLDSVSVFFKREQGAWRMLTAGSVFSQDDLQQLGIPRELWPYGENVPGPK